MSEINRLLTDAELELMNILWKIKEGSVKEVMSELPNDRKLAYTSVSTILRILEQKGIVKAEKKGRGHSYSPLLTKKEYGERSVRHMVENVFNDTPLLLAKALVNSQGLKTEDLDELKKMINETEI